MRPCLIFDLFHTLIPGDSGERERVVAQMATVVGVPPEELIRAYDDTFGTLRTQGWRLGLISNATAETALGWPDSALATHFEATVFSCEIRLAKPDAKRPA